MKIKGVFLAAILTAVLCFSGNVFAVLSGSGTLWQPYLIQSRADFDEFTNPANAAKYWANNVRTKLMSDIDLAGTTYTQAVIAPDTSTAVGFQGTLFAGIFDGDGHTISNLTITAAAQDFIGLFGIVDSGGQIFNLGVENVNIDGNGHWYIGGLVGRNYGTLAGCYASGSVTGSAYVGVLVGYTDGGTLTDCYATGWASGEQFIGGLLGRNNQGKVIRCYSTVKPTGNLYVGGLCGYVTGGAGYEDTGNFWDTETSQMTTSDMGTGKTTVQMKTLSTFTDAGWDFSADDGDWKMPFSGYPVLSVFTGTYSGGSGTVNDPYQIATKADLLALASNSYDYGLCFILTANIDLTGEMFNHAVIAPDTSTANGFQGTEFTGIFDGDGHTISNLTITAAMQDYIGLFGCVGSGGQIGNLGVENVNMTGSGYSGYVGGLVGWNSGMITACYASGSVSGSIEVGGLVGYNDQGTLTSCYASGSVTGTGYYTGGLVGSNTGTLTSCYASGSVSGSWYVGGLVGYNDQGTLTSCYASGSVTGTDNWVGGLVGWNDGTLTGCYASGSASGSWYVGGLVGYNGGSITACFWDIDTSGKTVGVGLGTSTGVIGKTTVEMKTLSTFTLAGWDFFGETVNGTEDIWDIHEGTDYPRFTWQMDDDLDGITDAVENGAPNGGDGNGDGIPDSDQSNVSSLPNAVNGSYVSLVAPEPSILFEDVKAIDNPSPGDSLPYTEFPIGFFEFKVSNIPVGGSTTVTILLPPGQTVNTYHKYGPTADNLSDHWYEFLWDGTTGAEILSDRIILHFVDGQRGDDDLTANGQIIEPGAPVFIPNEPPIANAGAEQSVYAWIDGFADVTLDGSDSNDADGDELTYKWTWTIDAITYEADGVSPTIELPVGVHTIQLVVNDGIVDSAPDDVNVTVVAPLEGNLKITPQAINRKSNQPDIRASIKLPGNITKNDVDLSEPLVLCPDENHDGIKATSQKILPAGNGSQKLNEIVASFDKTALMNAVPADSNIIELKVGGKLKSGQYFYGRDTVKIIK